MTRNSNPNSVGWGSVLSKNSGLDVLLDSALDLNVPFLAVAYAFAQLKLGAQLCLLLELFDLAMVTHAIAA